MKDNRQYGCCSQLTHDVLWWAIVGYHIYVIVSGISPFGIL